MNIEQINKQYEQLCAKIGDTQYKIRQFNVNLETLYSQADALNTLAAQVSKAAEAKGALDE